jgi:hypothetical protein
MDEIMLEIVKRLRESSQMPTFDDFTARCSHAEDELLRLSPAEFRPAKVFPTTCQYLIAAFKKTVLKTLVWRSVGDRSSLETAHMVLEILILYNGCIPRKDEKTVWKTDSSTFHSQCHGRVVDDVVLVRVWLGPFQILRIHRHPRPLFYVNAS